MEAVRAQRLEAEAQRLEADAQKARRKMNSVLGMLLELRASRCRALAARARRIEAQRAGRQLPLLEAMSAGKVRADRIQAVRWTRWGCSWCGNRQPCDSCWLAGKGPAGDLGELP